VVGGNVSLYNETDRGPIYPTPVVGMVGEVPDPAAAPGLAPNEGDVIALIGPFRPSLAGSELAKQRGELGPGLPDVDLAAAKTAIETVREAVRDGMVRVAHDVSDGGLAVALAELAIAGDVGLEVDLGGVIAAAGDEGNDEAWLFGEGPGGFLLAGDASKIGPVAETAGGAIIGRATGSQVTIIAGSARIATTPADAAAAWRSLGERMV
jgi:phosphoribosylformylglycinamidine (FGAM) synthase-like enzyme